MIYRSSIKALLIVGIFGLTACVGDITGPEPIDVQLELPAEAEPPAETLQEPDEKENGTTTEPRAGCDTPQPGNECSWKAPN